MRRHHPDCIHQSGEPPEDMHCPCEDWLDAVDDSRYLQRRVDEWKAASGLVCGRWGMDGVTPEGAKKYWRAIEGRLVSVEGRLVSVVDVLVKAIGAIGQEHADAMAGRAAKRIHRLEECINDYVDQMGICDAADDDGESAMCGSDQCSYCELVRAAAEWCEETTLTTEGE